MYALRYPDGDIDVSGFDLDDFRVDYAWARQMEAGGHALFADVEPVVQVGTNPDDYQWETFEDARVEIPDVWWDWFPDE